MTLSPADITAIAKAVAAELREVDRRQEDAKYLASLPIAEVKRLAREQMKRENRERKCLQR